MNVTSRRLARSAAGAAFVLALAVGCGSENEAPAGPDQPVQQEDAGDDGASDGGEGSDGDASDGGASDGGASDGGGATEGDSAASDGGGTAADSDLPADADLATTELPIPAEDAVQRALDASGGGDIHSISIDHDRRNGWEWEIEIRNGSEEHDIELSAISGEIIEHERDQDDDGEPAVDIADPLPYAEAIDLALGELDGRVSGWSLESDDDRVHYTVDIVSKGSDEDVDVEVDVETRETRIDD